MLNFFWEGESAFSTYYGWLFLYQINYSTFGMLICISKWRNTFNMTNSISKFRNTFGVANSISKCRNTFSITILYPNSETHSEWQILYPNSNMVTFDLPGYRVRYMKLSNDICPAVYWYLTENREWPGSVPWWKGDPTGFAGFIATTAGIHLLWVDCHGTTWRIK